MFLLPLAIVVWAATLTSPWLRRSIWAVTAVATVAAGVTDRKRPDKAVAAAVVTSTTSRPAPTRATTTQPPSTTRPSPSTTVEVSTSSASVPSVLPDAASASAVLEAIAVASERPEGYSREYFPTWVVVDGSDCDARIVVLRRESTAPIAPAGGGCSAEGGSWVSPYDGGAISDPGNAEIDHVVSVKEAWDSGAWAWTAEQRTAYANDVTDLRTLHVVTPAANRSKGDRDPSNWLPPRAEYVCVYVAEWLAVKARWGLTMDQSEAGRIRNLLKSPCTGLVIGPWTAPPTVSLRPIPTTYAPSDTAVAPTTPASTLGPYTPPPGSVPAVTAPPATPPAAAVNDVKPGAFCSVVGSTGSFEGRTYVCDRYSKTGSSYKSDEPHWRPV